jgi:hypothetical protein
MMMFHHYGLPKLETWAHKDVENSIHNQERENEPNCDIKSCYSKFLRNSRADHAIGIKCVMCDAIKLLITLHR